MNDTFFAYLQRLESIAFFSGYPLIYTIVLFITGSGSTKNKLRGKLFSLLPFSYALTGTLYLGLQLKNIYLDRSVESIGYFAQQAWLVGWGILAMIFWIPSFAKRPVLSLLHSFVFFFFLLKDLFFTFPAYNNNEHIIRNDMKLYTDSLLLNIGCLFMVTLIFFFYRRLTVNNESSRIK
jgi:hypothetical protein